MARSARPSWVRCSDSISTPISTNDASTMPSSSTVTWMPANTSASSGMVPGGKRRFSAPKMPWMPLFRMMATPMVAIIGIRWGALRLRSGLSTSTSTRNPSTPQKAKAKGRPTHSGMPETRMNSAAAYAPTMNTAPCERLMTPSTPNMSVKPSAKSA